MQLLDWGAKGDGAITGRELDVTSLVPQFHPTSFDAFKRFVFTLCPPSPAELWEHVSDMYVMADY